jgi:hypothetical protein
MSIVKLSDATEFHVVHPHQDCRGWPVVDALGRARGVVADLLVDTTNDRVTALRLATGDDLAVESVALRDGRVVVYEGDVAGSPGALPLAPIDPMAPPAAVPFTPVDPSVTAPPWAPDPIVLGRKA